MQLPNAQIQIHAVNDWYETAKVYQYGSYEQQRSKLYRCLGEVAEGVQKDNGLAVASAAGRLLWTFVGLMHFSKQAQDVELHDSLDHYIQLKLRATNKHAQLHALMHNTLDLVFQTPEDGDFCLHSFLKAFGDFMMSLSSLCRTCGLEFDRVVYNGHIALVRTKGEMNELGMFVRTPGDFDGDTRFASGATTRFLIEADIKACIARCFNPYKHAPFDVSMLPEINRSVNDAIDHAMERYIRNDSKWHGLLFERTPGITVDFSGGNASVKMNDDLMFVINELKKDTGSNETIS